jgi:zinc protease
MDDLKNHFRMGYAPNNCTMVVVGDVTLEEIVALARKYIEPIPRQEPPPPVRTVEPEQRGERRVTLHKAAQLPLVLACYHTPATNSPENYTLEALNQILSEGRSSRLYRRMVDRDQLVLSVNAGRDLSLDPGLFMFIMKPRTGVDPARAEKALYEELDRIAREGPTAEELQKAKNQIAADFYRELKTISGKANLLGRYEVYFGDHRKLFTAQAELEKVTLSDIKAVAAKYFGERNRTVATLIPEKGKEVAE